MASRQTIIIILSILFVSGCTETTTGRSVKQLDIDEIVETKRLAEEAYDNQEWEQVVVLNLKLIESLPAEPEPYFKLGNAYARLEQHGMAERAYKEALFRDKENAKIWHNLGVTQMRLAAMTLLEMQDYTEPKDELSVRARVLLMKLSEILGEDFSGVVRPQ